MGNGRAGAIASQPLPHPRPAERRARRLAIAPPPVAGAKTWATRPAPHRAFARREGQPLQTPRESLTVKDTSPHRRRGGGNPARIGYLRARPVLVHCQLGQTSYNACRILMGLGRTGVINLPGGYAAYAEWKRAGGF